LRLRIVTYLKQDLTEGEPIHGILSVFFGFVIYEEIFFDKERKVAEETISGDWYSSYEKQ
jgi:hypothetical protein